MSHDEKCNCEDKERCCCLHFRDSWTAGSIYRPGDAVPYNGSSYVAIHWNQNDPPPSGNWATIASKGDAGPAGPAGSTGPQGPTGSSILYLFQRSDNDPQVFTLGTGGQDIASLNVPAGSYLVMAMASLLNGDNDWQTWVLELHLDSTALTGTTVLTKLSGIINGTGAAGYATGGGTIIATCITAVPATLTLRGYGYNILSGAIEFVALPMGTIQAM